MNAISKELMVFDHHFANLFKVYSLYSGIKGESQRRGQMSLQEKLYYLTFARGTVFGSAQYHSSYDKKLYTQASP